MHIDCTARRLHTLDLHTLFPTKEERDALPDVCHLVLNDNDIECLSNMMAFPNLRSLEVSGNQLTTLHAPIASHSLVRIDLSYNHITNRTLTDSGVFTLAPMASLRDLNLSHNLLTSLDGFPQVAPNLTRLILTGNRIATLDGLRRYAASLEALDVRHNALEDSARVMSVFAGLEKLRLLRLEGNPLLAGCSGEQAVSLEPRSRQVHPQGTLSSIGAATAPMAPVTPRSVRKTISPAPGNQEQASSLPDVPRLSNTKEPGLCTPSSSVSTGVKNVTRGGGPYKNDTEDSSISSHVSGYVEAEFDDDDESRRVRRSKRRSKKSLSSSHAKENLKRCKKYSVHRSSVASDARSVRSSTDFAETEGSTPEASWKGPKQVTVTRFPSQERYIHSLQKNVLLREDSIDAELGQIGGSANPFVREYDKTEEARSVYGLGPPRCSSSSSSSHMRRLSEEAESLRKEVHYLRSRCEHLTYENANLRTLRINERDRFERILMRHGIDPHTQGRFRRTHHHRRNRHDTRSTAPQYYRDRAVPHLQHKVVSRQHQQEEEEEGRETHDSMESDNGLTQLLLRVSRIESSQSAWHSFESSSPEDSRTDFKTLSVRRDPRHGQMGDLHGTWVSSREGAENCSPAHRWQPTPTCDAPRTRVPGERTNLSGTHRDRTGISTLGGMPAGCVPNPAANRSSTTRSNPTVPWRRHGNEPPYLDDSRVATPPSSFACLPIPSRTNQLQGVAAARRAVARIQDSVYESGMEFSTLGTSSTCAPSVPLMEPQPDGAFPDRKRLFNRSIHRNRLSDCMHSPQTHVHSRASEHPSYPNSSVPQISPVSSVSTSTGLRSASVSNGLIQCSRNAMHCTLSPPKARVAPRPHTLCSSAVCADTMKGSSIGSPPPKVPPPSHAILVSPSPQSYPLCVSRDNPGAKAESLGNHTLGLISPPVGGAVTIPATSGIGQRLYRDPSQPQPQRDSVPLISSVASSISIPPGQNVSPYKMRTSPPRMVPPTSNTSCLAQKSTTNSHTCLGQSEKKGNKGVQEISAYGTEHPVSRTRESPKAKESPPPSSVSPASGKSSAMSSFFESVSHVVTEPVSDSNASLTGHLPLNFYAFELKRAIDFITQQQELVLDGPQDGTNSSVSWNEGGEAPLSSPEKRKCHDAAEEPQGRVSSPPHHDVVLMGGTNEGSKQVLDEVQRLQQWLNNETRKLRAGVGSW